MEKDPNLQSKLNSIEVLLSDIKKSTQPKLNLLFYGIGNVAEHAIKTICQNLDSINVEKVYLLGRETSIGKHQLLLSEANEILSSYQAESRPEIIITNEENLLENNIMNDLDFFFFTANSNPEIPKDRFENVKYNLPLLKDVKKFFDDGFNGILNIVSNQPEVLAHHAANDFNINHDQIVAGVPIEELRYLIAIQKEKSTELNKYKINPFFMGIHGNIVILDELVTAIGKADGQEFHSIREKIKSHFQSDQIKQYIESDLSNKLDLLESIDEIEGFMNNLSVRYSPTANLTALAILRLISAYSNDNSTNIGLIHELFDKPYFGIVPSIFNRKTEETNANVKIDEKRLNQFNSNLTQDKKSSYINRFKDITIGINDSTGTLEEQIKKYKIPEIKKIKITKKIEGTRLRNVNKKPVIKVHNRSLEKKLKKESNSKIIYTQEYSNKFFSFDTSQNSRSLAENTLDLSNVADKDIDIDRQTKKLSIFDMQRDRDKLHILAKHSNSANENLYRLFEYSLKNKNFNFASNLIGGKDFKIHDMLPKGNSTKFSIEYGEEYFIAEYDKKNNKFKNMKKTDSPTTLMIPNGNDLLRMYENVLLTDNLKMEFPIDIESTAYAELNNIFLISNKSKMLALDLNNIENRIMFESNENIFDFYENDAGLIQFINLDNSNEISISNYNDMNDIFQENSKIVKTITDPRVDNINKIMIQDPNIFYVTNDSNELYAGYHENGENFIISKIGDLPDYDPDYAMVVQND